MSSGIYITNIFDSVYYNRININTINEIEDKLKELKDQIVSTEKQIFTFTFINHKDKLTYFDLYKEFEDLLDSYKEVLFDYYRYEQIKSMIDYNHVKIYDENYGYFIKVNNEFIKVTKEEYDNYKLE